MNISVRAFNKVNRGGIAMKSGVELLNKILTENPTRFPLILDVGCGDGEVTKMVAQNLNPHTLLALDIDPNMIHFAQQHQSDQFIAFLTQDFGVGWSKLNGSLHAIENGVDLIFSNYTFHWIPDWGKQNVAAHVARLLKSGGLCYSRFHIMKDITQFCTEYEDQEWIQKVVKIPSPENQLRLWRNLFESHGLKVTIEVMERCHDYGSPQGYQMSWKLFVAMYDQYLVGGDVSEKTKRMATDLFMRAYAWPPPSLYGEELGREGGQICHQDVVQMICSKIE